MNSLISVYSIFSIEICSDSIQVNNIYTCITLSCITCLHVCWTEVILKVNFTGCKLKHNFINMATLGKSYIYIPETVDILYTSIPDKLKELAEECPDREAVIFCSPDGGRCSITYFQLYTNAELFAKRILTYGFERGSIIAVANINTPEWLICTFGLQMAGLVPLHFAFARESPNSVVNLLNGVGNCVAIILDSSDIGVFKQFIETMDTNGKAISTKIPSLQNVFPMNAFNDEQIPSGQCNLPYITADDICGIFLTSGSSGLAKAVPMTHMRMIEMGVHWGKLLDVQPGEKFFNDKPFSWQGSYPSIWLATKGSRVTVTDIFAMKSVEEINDFTLRVLESESCVSAFLLTPCISDLLSRKELSVRVFPLRVICTAGLPVDSFCANVIGRTATKFAVAYGCTEIGFMCSTVVNSNEYENYEVGQPLPGTEIKIVDENEHIVQKGTTGEIYVRLRYRFLGYLNAKQKAEQCCDKTGWYKTDDVGYVKPDNSVVVTGRKSDMMVIGGALVSPSYIEGVLKTHPSVANVYIGPVHDKQTFQHGCAAIILKKDKTVTVEELVNFLTKEKGKYAESFLGNLHVPKTFLFFESFPKTHSGKLDRKALKDEIKKRL